MGKVLRNVFKNDKFILSETTNGFYLYDNTLSHNISMRAKTEQDALIEALTYYQKTFLVLKNDYIDLNNKVQNFLNQFDRNDD